MNLCYISLAKLEAHFPELVWFHVKVIQTKNLHKIQEAEIEQQYSLKVVFGYNVLMCSSLAWISPPLV